MTSAFTPQTMQTFANGAWSAGNTGTDIYFDEAYYWQWAQHLDWGYYDHPPLVAWLIAAPDHGAESAGSPRLESTMTGQTSLVDGLRSEVL